MAAKKPLHPLDLVVRRGLRINRSAFTVYFKLLRETYRPRIVVSQKTDKRATVRNQLRRRIRGVLQNYPTTNIGLVIICHPPIIKLLAGQLRQELVTVFDKLKWPT
jgi:ribonuclease P protein component